MKQTGFALCVKALESAVAELENSNGTRKRPEEKQDVKQTGFALCVKALESAVAELEK